MQQTANNSLSIILYKIKENPTFEHKNKSLGLLVEENTKETLESRDKVNNFMNRTQITKEIIGPKNATMSN